MSVTIMADCWKTPCESHTQKLVLIAIADNANDQGWCWPSLQHLQNKCDLSSEGVRKQIRALEEQKLIEVKRASGKVSNYVVHPKPLNAVVGSTPLGGQRRSTHPATPLGGACYAVATNHKEPSGSHQGEGERAGALPSTVVRGQRPPPVPPKASRFVKPSLEEVRGFMSELSMPAVEAEKFWHHFEANGWKAGKVGMRDWRSAIHKWKLRNEAWAKEKAAKASPSRNSTNSNAKREGQYDGIGKVP